MKFDTLELHPGFPDQLWVVVEQPADEKYRLRYDPTRGEFVRTEIESLLFVRGFSGAYGWVGGLGAPPGKHLDIFLITRKKTKPGDILLGYLCGIFFRGDGDHKLIALDADLIGTVARADLSSLDERTVSELKAIYPNVGANEGWFGADQARKYLQAHLKK